MRLLQWGTIFVLLASAQGFAQENRRKHHREHEVKNRIHSEEKRIERNEAAGRITPQQAQQEQQNLNNIRKENREDMKANGGYITKGQQQNLNQQLNQESKEIHQDATGH